MRTLLITVAGKSTRFSKSIGRPVLKCIYSPDGDLRKSILYRLLEMGSGYDRFVIVGGFRFDELREAVGRMDGFRDRIDLVYNERYEDGSGYSLRKGLEKALETGFDELTFAEGDLWVDPEEFRSIMESDRDVITFNREPILADKAVAVYTTPDRRVHYIYDTNHKDLRIDGPFTAIYNSGQIWKFSDSERVRRSFDAISDDTWLGTNLVFIQQYFGDMDIDGIQRTVFSKWLNCNTVEDYNMIEGYDDEGHQ